MKNPFANWTMAQVAEHNARVYGKSSAVEDKRTPKAVERERDLHGAIEDYCRSRGYLYRHDRMDAPTTGQVGWPDFTIFMPHKRCVLLECKAKGKKPTKEQMATLAHAANFGFVAKVVDNYADAVRWIEAEASGNPVATEDAGEAPMIAAVRKAKSMLLPDKREELVAWVKKHGKFTGGEISEAVNFAKSEEGECRTLWQLVQGFTAYARGFEYVGSRVDLEKRAGALLEVASVKGGS